MQNFYDSKIANTGVNYGGVLVQAHGSVGGSRNVFVKYQGQAKNGLVFPPIGGFVKNPFKGYAKAYAGDLAEYKINGEVLLLKTYEVAADVESTDTTVTIVRDGYRHIPFVGDILMVAPSTLSGTGTAVTVTAVSASADAWTLTLSAALGEVPEGGILVEASAAGASATMLVTNPNSYLPCDVDFLFDPQANAEDFDGARYTLTPCLANEDTKLYVNKMSPLPDVIKALNRSKVEGWFNL